MNASTLSDDDFRKAFAKGVYFHAVGGPLTHNAGCLAEGMMALGIPVKLCAGEITSRHASMPLAGMDLTSLVSPPYAGFGGYIVDITHTNEPVAFERIGDAPLAYLNQSDIATFSSAPGHLLFCTHENRFVSKDGDRRPIAFGISNGLIAATAEQPSFASRSRSALRNVRPTLSQSVRALLDISYVPLLEGHMPVDRTAHPPARYLAALLNAAVSLAYGGDFYMPIADNPCFRTHDPALADRHRFARLDAPALILRWDSWRLWESFACGCVTVHLHFEKYGFALPVMPVAWEHYVPIDLDDIAGSVGALFERASDWAAIAARGRAFALAHYAPAPTARRVLSAMLEKR
jgi:hypothetical protein